MALPYNYNKKYSFSQEDYPQINSVYMRKAIYTVFANDKFIQEKETEISFSSNNTLINFAFNFDVVIKQEDELNLRITIHLVNLLKITVVLLVFIALFSQFAFRNYLLFAGIFIGIFYVANVIFISNYLNKKVKKALKLMGYNQEEIYSNEQKEWLMNPLKCNACGGAVTENHLVCPDCGLQIKQNRYTKPLDLSSPKTIQEPNIRYHYKNKK